MWGDCPKWITVALMWARPLRISNYHDLAQSRLTSRALLCLYDLGMYIASTAKPTNSPIAIARTTKAPEVNMSLRDEG